MGCQHFPLSTCRILHSAPEVLKTGEQRRGTVGKYCWWLCQDVCWLPMAMTQAGGPRYSQLGGRFICVLPPHSEATIQSEVFILHAFEALCLQLRHSYVP